MMKSSPMLNKLYCCVAPKQEGEIRVVSGEQDSTGHGPITYYQVPFREGTFSASWKVEKEQSVAFIFDAANQGKATHLLKVIVNGGPGTKSRSDHLTLITYDGSSRAKKKARSSATNTMQLRANGIKS